MNILPAPKSIVPSDGVCAAPENLQFVADDSIPAEGCRICVKADGITVASSDDAGAFYARQTLAQLGDAPACGVIEDAPRYGWRSFMLDCSRHFFSIDEVKKLVDVCASLKLNRFHWHLSDDQGYRIESKRFPKLNEIGSRRDEDGPAADGFYTFEEIRELVAYAAERFITVVPEIDLPGHTSAITAAYPELSCSGQPGKVETGAGIFPRILCGGKDAVYSFLEELLEEVCPLFPGKWFHIGGDEAPKQEWKACPLCQGAMGKYGLKDEEELQAHFTARLEEMLAKHGKVIIGWNEILASGTVSPTAIAQYWTDGGATYSALEIPKGRQFIFSNGTSFYLDYDHNMLTLKGAYIYEPMIPGGQAIPPEQVLGLEAPLWTEWVTDNERLETMAFPRLAALAENAWSQKKDWEDFVRRLTLLAARWDEQGLCHYPIEQAVNPRPEDAAAAVIAQLRRWGGDELVRQAMKAPEATGPLRRLLSPAYSREELDAIAQAILAQLPAEE